MEVTTTAPIAQSVCGEGVGGRPARTERGLPARWQRDDARTDTVTQAYTRLDGAPIIVDTYRAAVGDASLRGIMRMHL